ncbi:SCO6745 family protein [Amycolatopsis sp. H20-H5]|uniref:SCO6745 family protein n=1 Tax=Amycolatopsis sp. H20-H5 TaxID=3046309 RepID=UPI002DB5775B|nr:hypothetical protein [Amycolatopsis sp. H20-H5]MEC3980739.1 hypothetical protein [Amycolatopsis sp. H20-H5]
MTITLEPDVARSTWRAAEVYHGMIYFAPEAMAAYAELGLSSEQGYFASRSAAMGVVPPELVVATFFNFSPRFVHASLDGVWSKTDPATVLAARSSAADKALRGALGDAVHSPELARVAELLRSAAETITGDVVGRPLFAAHAALHWPSEPHLVLWHAQTLLREYRGDAHIAALLTAGLGGLDSLLTHAAVGGIRAEVLRKTRSWPETEWQQGIESLRDRGWLTADAEPTFTPDGKTRRDELESATDRNSLAPYARIGDEACAEIRTLIAPFAQTLTTTFMPWAAKR